MRVAILNNRADNVKAMRRLLAEDPGVDLAWTAKDKDQAQALLHNDPPDLLLVEPDLPGGNTVALIRRLVEEAVCAVLVVADKVKGNERLVFEAMAAGALDAVPSPRPGRGGLDGGEAFLGKMATMAKLLGGASGRRPRPDPTAQPTLPPPGPLPRLVALGCSTGGPKALSTILPQLPDDFSAAVVVIQHVDRQFSAGFADWLNSQCTLPVRVAKEGDRLKAGEILVAGQGEHLILGADKTLHYTPNPADNPYKPSVDVFFGSLAAHPFRSSLAAVLTGMGRDGAEGLKLLRDKGWQTLAQDEATSVVYGMPRAAAALNAAKSILPLNKIGREILAFIQDHNKTKERP